MAEFSGEGLKYARQKQDLKQLEFAVALGDRYSQAAISGVGTNWSGLKSGGLLLAAEIMNISVDYLPCLTDEMRPLMAPPSWWTGVLSSCGTVWCT